jgi:thiopeptide-type bacteriocin biosynthesis protein
VREDTLLRLLNETLAAGNRELELTAANIKALEAPAPLPLPGAFAATASIAAASDEALQRGQFRVVLHGAEGPSGARLLARCCEASPELHSLVAEHLCAEEALDPEAVYAEVVHLPDARLGNVVRRPVLRAYEIPYLGRSGAPPERQIALNDLLVSVRGGEVVLRSTRLARRVIPRQTSGHRDWDPASPLLIRFFGAVQRQGVCATLRWDWGPLAAAPFLPRVTSGRLVLSRARWRVGGDEAASLSAEDGSARWCAVQAWRGVRGLPRFVALAGEEGELPFDLDNALSVDTLVHLLSTGADSVLVECLPEPGEMAVRGPEGRFVHELIVPFVRPAPLPCDRPPSNPQRFAARPRLQRQFPPGGEWLYAKLYTGPALADRVLRTAVDAVIAEARREGWIDRWFFIRYGDPDWHIRLRMHGHPELLYANVLPLLHRLIGPLVEQGTVLRIQIDTYEREIERYGGAGGMVLSERLFEADSDAAMAIMRASAGPEGLDARWRLAIAGIDGLLDDLGFELPRKTVLLRRGAEALAQELDLSAAFRRATGQRYRAERTSLQALIGGGGGGSPNLAAGFAAFTRRSADLADVIAGLKRLERAGRLDRSLEEIARSYVHMHVNRLLRSSHRLHEFILYDWLCRLYAAQEARE